MKRVITLLFFVISLQSFGQISAGTDDTVCGGSATLTATLSSAAPTSLTLSDDQFSGVINIGFPFTFYGNSYTQCVISSNNYISFNIGQAGGFSPWSIVNPVPNAGNPLNATMGPWQDINPGVGGTVRYALVGTSPNRIFVVEYCNVPMFSCTTMNFSSQIQLHENGNVVQTHIINKPLCASWNSGRAIHAMHNSTGGIADVVTGRNSPTQWTTSLEGMNFTPNGPNAYTITTIPFNPVVLGANGTITWSQVGGGVIGTGATVSVTPTTTTEYVASIQDLCSGATFTDTVRVVVNTPFNFNGSFTTVTSCSSPTGSATVVINSGSGNYTYAWDDPALQTTATASGLTAGTYTVTVNDLTLGCTEDTSFVVTDSNNLALSIVSQENISCNGANDGTATVGISGSNGIATVLWSNGETAATAVALVPGVNTVTVTDADGCTGQTSVILTEPQPLTATISGFEDAACFGESSGEATVAQTGGNGAPYTFLWDDPSAQTTATATGLPAGTYTVIITDSEGCNATATVTINEPTALTGSMSSQNISCNGFTDGSATFTVNGGTQPYTYLWPLSGTTTNSENNMIAGTFTITATDANGCTITDTVTITQPAPISMTFTNTDAECGLSDGTSMASPVGGTGPYTYQWNAAAGNQTSQTATGLATGNYSVTVTDANGCTAGGTTFIDEYFNTTAGFIASPTEGIYPLPVNFTNTSTNGSTYEWIFGDNNSTTVTNTNSVSNTYANPGVYTAMLITYNAGGCSDTAYVTITVLNNSTLIVYNVFSPNGDGFNDLFITTNQYITEFSMTITNRWGQVEFSTSDVTQGWDGKNQKSGKECPEGTYYYMIVAKGHDDADYKFSGHVTLLRD